MADSVNRRLDPEAGSVRALDAVEIDEEEGEYRPPRTIVTRGEVGEDLVEYARKRLDRVIDQIAAPVWFVRTKLSIAEPGRQRPALAEVTVDVDGDLVRAHVAASGMHEAIDLLQRRVRDQLEHRAQRRRARRRASGTAGVDRRRGQPPAPAPEYVERSPDERQLVRRKTFAIDEMTPEEAAFDMNQLDHQFYLFRDLAGGEDSLLWRESDGSLLLNRLHPSEVDTGPAPADIAVDDRTPPTLTIEEAVDSLDASRLPFLFFADATTGRGNVVYRRYDGHYGLITPA